MKLSRDAGGIDLYREASFGEVHLHLGKRPCSGSAGPRFMLAQQIVDELLARIIGIFSAGYIRLKAEGDITLLYRNMRMACDIQVTVCVRRTGTAHVRRAVAAYDRLRTGCETIRGRVRKPMHAVRREIEYFLCSPSVTTGEPASNRSMVSRTASSKKGARLGSSLSPFATLSMRSAGLGMLPMGSVVC